MMLTRRTLGLTTLGLAVSATLAACSSNSQDEATEAGKMALIVSDAGETASEELSKAVEAFTKETKVEVDVKTVSDISQELARGITADPTVDVVVLNPAQLSSYAGSLHAWDQGSTAVKDAHPALVTSATRQGRISAAPRDVSTLALFINTSLWSAAGLGESVYPTTWEQLEQVAASLTSDGVVGLTLDASYSRVGAFMVQGGGGLTSADGTQATASSEGSVAGLTEVKNLLSSGSAGWGADLPAGSAADAFGQGQAAMAVETDALVKTLADVYSGVSYAVVELPAGSGGKGTLQFPSFYAVVEASKHKADAIRLVEYLTGAERQVALAGAAGTVPAGRSAGETWKGKHADQAAFLAGVEYSQAVPSAPGVSDVIANLDNELPGLAAGDPAAILAGAQVNLEALLS
ncbi:extracellular solute-binding protein [Actinomyces viscosus]|uniref:Maltose ABC transporter periplasmic protein n=1 Tax=Actinomyces viscosus TaxID=1656 RepID=A0A448PLZ8_ACTVI|nr:extracellular solute-binding protein [Actinomyces viscosus]TFH51475.1 extracellular solute-binding protein [Actinomyces viscosus]VEI16805.1 maltose ABC transporter periplasmic protein [Actinomyces viscosus]